MAQIKISEMPTASTVNLTDYVPIVQEGINKKTSVQNFVGNEAERIEAEKKRVEAEEARAAAERSRVQFEEIRKRDETTRTQNEENRTLAEEARAQAEESRVSSEEARVASEERRVAAENTRVNNENERIKNENTRKQNEEERIKNEEDRYYNGLYVSGETYSGIASNKGIKLHKVVGKTEQGTTKGYQLFDASKLPSKSGGGANVNNNEDGSYTIGGSGNLSTIFNHYVTLTKEETLKILKKGTLFGKVDSSVAPYPCFLVYANGQYTELNLPDTNLHSIEITEEMLNADDLYSRLRFYSSSGQPIKTGTVKPIIYQDGDGTWEPYTGGEPAPNADYPMEIKNVEIKKIKSIGKNICDGVNQNYFISYEATSFGVAGSNSGLIIPTNGAQTMTVSTKNVQDRYRIGVSNNQMEMNKTGAIFRGQNLDGTNQSKTIDTSGYKYLVVNASNLTDIQVELGSIATEYKPYEGATVETSLTLAEGDVFETGVAIRKMKEANVTRDFAFSLQGTYENTLRFDSQYLTDKKSTSGKGYCNLLPKGSDSDNGDYEHFRFSSANKGFVIYINKSRLETPDVSGLAKYLDTAGMKLLYELDVPTTETLKVPTIPSYNPHTNIWTDNTLSTDIEWELLANSDNSLYQEELEKRIQALEAQILGL